MTSSASPATFVAALITALTVFSTCPGSASAQSVANGRTLYSTPQVSGSLSCGNAQCHSNDPSTNQNRIRAGSNNPTAILNAINGGVSTMAFLRGTLSTVQLADLAAYIANPRAANTAPVASLSSPRLILPPRCRLSVSLKSLLPLD